MATEILSAQKRTATGKGAARKLRAARQVPGIVYGHHREPMAISLDARELERMLERVSADTTVFDLTIGKDVARSLIREVQRDPLRRAILHVDFQELVAGEAVTVDVPVVLVGTADGVRNQGGTMDQIMRSVSIEVDPANIPNHFDLDVTLLALNQSLHVSDLKLPAGVKVLEDADSTICVVVPPRIEEVAAPAAAEGVEGAEGAAPAEPELIRKPKAADEEAEGEPAKGEKKEKK
ncbi:MAG TPA: 50S ribosomal protein L25/general stress protein Ctc [Gemmatimonadaceae bacterium]|nr:50S ribosomal protein L25/general stress protein Ctc [Gemmatimonadaceae bacterium]